MPNSDLQERYQDGRNIRAVGDQKRFLSFEKEYRLQGGLGVGESRCKCPGFVQGIHTNHTALSSTNPDIWGEENMLPCGRPDGDFFGSPEGPNHREPVCDLYGEQIDTEFWSEKDDIRLAEELPADYTELEFGQDELDFDRQYEAVVQELLRSKPRARRGKRKTVPRIRVNLKKAVSVAFKN